MKGAEKTGGPEGGELKPSLLQQCCYYHQKIPGEVTNCEVDLAKWVVGEVFVTYTNNIELD